MKVKIYVAAAITLVVVSPLYLNYRAEARKDEWDNRIAEMCVKDGGISVFERVEISREIYPEIVITSKGVQIQGSTEDSAPFYSTFEGEVIRHQDPRVMRLVTRITRREDQKVLGELIEYMRIGGDFLFSLGASSSSSCGNDPEAGNVLSRSIFSLIGE